MVNRVLRTNKKFSLFENGDKIIVALSGGADSVSLLHVLNSLKEQYGLTLYAAHLNHGIRGEEADRDERFCKILCENYNVELFTAHRDIPSLSKSQRISEELCGRNERYAFFKELSKKTGAKIATAHTASDNAETLIFNITRGASVSGASGIPPKRGNIIRPLIEQTREQIEAYCLENKLSYVTDSTNLSTDYTRNKIRSQIIPLLKTLNPSFESAALRFTQSAAEAKEYLEISAEKAIEESKTDYGYDINILEKNYKAVLHAALAKICGGSAENHHIEAITEKLSTGGSVSLTDGKTAVCTQGILRIVEKTEKSQIDFLLEIPPNGEISFEFGDTNVCAEIDLTKAENINPVFRTRKSGDRFTYPRRNITKPLRKMMNEQKIPSEQRDKTLLLCSQNTVLWCMGVGYSAQGEALQKSAGLKIKINYVTGGYYAQER